MSSERGKKVKREISDVNKTSEQVLGASVREF